MGRKVGETVGGTVYREVRGAVGGDSLRDRPQEIVGMMKSRKQGVQAWRRAENWTGIFANAGIGKPGSTCNTRLPGNKCDAT